MGTHPIFESDFDCLTESRKWAIDRTTKLIMNHREMERCSSAPILNYESEQAGSTANNVHQILRPTSIRLRRHSSLNRGLLHNVRKISESDERTGEAKINTSISLNSSTEKLNLSSTPSSPIQSPNILFRPIKMDSPERSSPEKNEYALRSRQQPGKQLYRPSSGTRKRRSRCVYDNDTPTPTQNSRITKRTKIDCDTCLRTTSSDSGISTTETFSDLSANINTPPSPSNDSRIIRPRSGSNLDFWWAKNERVRRLSTESIVSVDSITKEINKT